MATSHALGNDGLTRRQRQIWEFMLAYHQRHGLPPTLQEIGIKFKLASLASSSSEMQALLRKGKVRTHTRGTRTYHIAIPEPSSKEKRNATRRTKVGA